VGAKAISIHGRTRAQMYKGEANWKPIAEVKNNPRMFIPVFGNGDVNSPEKAKLMRDEFGLDGAMIGRASIGNPWFFNQVKVFLKTGEKTEPPSVLERINVAKRHLEMSIKWKGDRLGVLETRRHYSNYFKGIKDFKPYRTKLVTLESTKELMNLFSELEEINETLLVTA
jgi:tRNA-dihydrouridine synthase